MCGLFTLLLSEAAPNVDLNVTLLLWCNLVLQTMVEHCGRLLCPTPQSRVLLVQ